MVICFIYSSCQKNKQSFIILKLVMIGLDLNKSLRRNMISCSDFLSFLKLPEKLCFTIFVIVF